MSESFMVKIHLNEEFDIKEEEPDDDDLAESDLSSLEEISDFSSEEETSKNGLETPKNGFKSFKNGSESSKNGFESSKNELKPSISELESSKNGFETSKNGFETPKSGSETSKNGSESSKNGFESSDRSCEKCLASFTSNFSLELHIIQDHEKMTAKVSRFFI